MLLKYGGNLVCLGEQGNDRKEYVDIAVRAGLSESSQQDDDDEFKPKHYKELASFTLMHFMESMRKLVQVLANGNTVHGDNGDSAAKGVKDLDNKSDM
jgi:hypothetical protein